MNITLFWLVLFVVLVVIELCTMGLTTIWFAGGALVGTLAAMVHLQLWQQIVLFLTVSIILLFFTRPIAVKYFNKERTRTNVESYVGRQVIVVSEIDNLQGIGQVTLGGQEWTARTARDGITLPVGTVGIVKAVSGVKLIIEEKKAEVR
jgi:membrane protein implicated in regulation of membrane protease activity